MKKSIKDPIVNIPFIAIAIFFALCLGWIVRYPYIFTDDIFPLGDGGLFMAMIEAVQSNHYLLPDIVTYNSYTIPFTYPPLGFYLASFTANLFGTSNLFIARFLPLTLNFLTIIAFVLLSSELVKDKFELFICSALFPVIFQSYEWVIKAGGITRSAGFLFLVITLYFLCLFQRRKNFYQLVFVIIFLSATILSHPEWGMIAVIFTGIYLLIVDFNHLKNQVFTLIIIGAGTLLLTSLWWANVISNFGITPFLMAKQAIQLEESQFSNVIQGGIFLITITTFSNGFIPWLAIFGVMVDLYKREFFVPIWLLSVYLLAPRNIAIFGIIPVVFLVMYGLRGINEFIVQRISFLKSKNTQVNSINNSFYSFPVSFLYLAIIFFVVFTKRANLPIVHPIAQSNRVAMEFIKENTSAESKFVVITPYNWYDADTAEWFPYLTGRESLTTPQGIEWISGVEFRNIVNIVAHLSGLARSERSSYETSEILEYVELEFPEYDYVAIFISNVLSRFGGFVDSGRYNLIYHKKDVLIFDRLD